MSGSLYVQDGYWLYEYISATFADKFLFTYSIQYCGTPNYSVIFLSVSSLAMTTCIIAKLMLAKRMLPRNAIWPVTYEDDLSQLRNHAVRLFHNVINRSQVACLNIHSYCCLQASNLLKRLLASLTHQSIPIEGKYDSHKERLSQVPHDSLFTVTGTLHPVGKHYPKLRAGTLDSCLKFLMTLYLLCQGRCTLWGSTTPS